MAEPDRIKSLFDQVAAGWSTEPQGSARSPAAVEAALTALAQRLNSPQASERQEPAASGDTGPASPPEPHPGDFVGQYRLLARVGSVGFATSWLAERDHPTARLVTLFVISPGPASDRALRCFEEQGRALRSLNHPNVVRVYDAGADESGRAYFAMEHVQGESIMAHADRRRLTIRQRIELFEAACEGVAHAHLQGVVHGELTAERVLVCDQENGCVPRVALLGIGRAVLAATGEGGASAAEAPAIDARSDIRALGEVLYELLTAVRPFADALPDGRAGEEAPSAAVDPEPVLASARITHWGEGADEVARMRHTRPAELAKALRGTLDVVLAKSLSARPDDGYQTLAEFTHDLRTYLAGQHALGRADADSGAQPTWSLRRIAPFLVAGGVVLAMGISAYAIIGRANSAGRTVESQRQQLSESQARLEAVRLETEAEHARLEQAVAQADSEVKAVESDRKKLTDAVAQSTASARAARVEREKLSDAVSKANAQTKAADAERKQLEEATSRAQAQSKAAATDRTQLAERTAALQVQSQAVEAERKKLAEATTKVQAERAAAEKERKRLAAATADSAAQAQGAQAERKKLAAAAAKAEAAAGAAAAERKRLADAAAKAQTLAQAAEGDRAKLAAATAQATAQVRALEEERKQMADATAKASAAADATNLERRQLAQAAVNAQTEASNAEAERKQLSDALAKVEAETQALEAERATLARAEGEQKVRSDALQTERQRLTQEAATYENEAKAVEAERAKVAETADRARLQREALQAERQQAAEAAAQPTTQPQPAGEDAEVEQESNPKPESTSNTPVPQSNGRIAVPIVDSSPAPAAPTDAGSVSAAAPLNQAASAPTAAERDPGALARRLGEMIRSEAGRSAGSLDREVVDRTMQQVEAEFTDRPDVRASMYTTIAEALGESAVPALAIEPQERALTIRRAEQGEDHPQTIEALYRAAQWNEKAGKLTEAESAYRETLERQRRVLGIDDARTLRTMNDLGGLMLRQGRPAAADALLDEAVRSERRVLGAQHPTTLISMSRRGVALNALGRYHDAAQLLAGGDAAARRVLAGSDDAALGEYLAALGVARLGQRAYASAEGALKDAYQHLTSGANPNAEAAEGCARNLIALYESWHRAQPDKGHDAQAAVWRARLFTSSAAVSR